MHCRQLGARDSGVTYMFSFWPSLLRLGCGALALLLDSQGNSFLYLCPSAGLCDFARLSSREVNIKVSERLP